jgi:hypothetical protein
MSAQYQLVTDNAISLPDGTDIDTTLDFTCPNIAGGHRPVLFYSLDPAGSGMRLKVTINGVLIVNQQVDNGARGTVNEAIDPDLLKPNGNTLELRVENGDAAAGKVLRISDIVVLYRETT